MSNSTPRAALPPIDTIAMARQAGFVLEGDLSGAGRLPMLLEHFAALVRAEVMREMADSGHSATAVAEASTAPLPEGNA